MNHIKLTKKTATLTAGTMFLIISILLAMNIYKGNRIDELKGIEHELTKVEAEAEERIAGLNKQIDTHLEKIKELHRQRFESDANLKEIESRLSEHRSTIAKLRQELQQANQDLTLTCNSDVEDLEEAKRTIKSLCDTNELNKLLILSYEEEELDYSAKISGLSLSLSLCREAESNYIAITENQKSIILEKDAIIGDLRNVTITKLNKKIARLKKKKRLTRLFNLFKNTAAFIAGMYVYSKIK